VKRFRHNRAYTYGLGIVTVVAATLSVFLLHPLAVSAAACTVPTTDYGTVTQTVTIPGSSSTTFRIWSRLESSATDSTANSYLLQIDGSSCYTVGGSTISSSSWTWVDYQNGNASSTVNASLSPGNHSIVMIGDAAGVKLDRLIFTADTACVPTGTGDNCANPPDTTPPVASITSPVNNASVSGTITVVANATDDSGTVSKVELYVDSGTTAVTTATTSTNNNFNLSLNTTTLTPGTHTIYVKAYDPSNNVASSGTITISVPDQSSPTNVTITAPANNAAVSGTITVTATAQDNVGVTRMNFVVDSQAPMTVNSSPFTTSLDTTKLSNATHTITATAFDAAGNSASSSPITITVNNTGCPSPDTTTPGVTVTAPAVNAIVAGKAIPIAATATDACGIKQVAIQIDGQTKSTVTAAPFGMNLDTTTLTAGQHTITARATDNSTSQNVGTATETIRVTSMADINRDCKVNFSDISVIIPGLGSSGTNLGNADVNGDNKINFTDISIVIGDLGQTPC
jgi:hypothetical protein